MIFLTDYQEIYFDGDGNYTAGADTDPIHPDTDLDEHLDGLDAFPLDPNEWSDRDGDGVGDNSDFDPDDPDVWENFNQPPVAAINGETIYELESTEGSLIHLDGNQSTDPDEGDIIESYTWSGTFGTVQGETLEVTLPLGDHEITLVVNDGDEDSNPASVTVTVQDSVLPTVTITSPESRTYKISEDNPILSYESFDVGGIAGETTTLNGQSISNGSRWRRLIQWDHCQCNQTE